MVLKKTLFARNLTSLRRYKDVTQAEICSQLDIRQTTWSNYEMGHTEPNIETIILISNYFGITIDALLKENLEDVQVINKFVNKEFQGNNTGKVTGKGTGKYPKNEILSVLNEDAEMINWTFVKLLKEMDQKLDLILKTPHHGKGK